MGFLGFGKKSGSHLVAVMYEGPGRLRLNGNRIQDSKIKQRATTHPWTVCWIEFTSDGIPKDQGSGPAADKVGAAEVEKLLRELPRSTACRQVLDVLKQGQDQTGKWLQLGASQPHN